jgi:phosphatidylserine/phosphatidylglycerophosphate/cardiolipin synthase-like enzyme
MTVTISYTNPGSGIALDVAAFAAATKTIDMAAYALDDPSIVAALLAASRRAVTIRIYLDRTELEASARGNRYGATTPLHTLINATGITIKVKKSSVLMHLKSYCVDGATLRDGSANFSTPGETVQDNSVTFITDPAAIALFQEKYNAMWARPDNLTVAQAVQQVNRIGPAPSHLHRR